MTNTLFTPIQVGDLTLNNRIVMAPLTRNRADQDNAPHELNVLYYKQRSNAGLIITEAAQISPEGVGYPSTPGIYNDLQVEKWKHVTQAVHQAGSRIFIQLIHCGRISHPSLLPNGQQPVAPSAIRPEGEAVTYQGPQEFVTPRELSSEEIPQIIAQYKHAAQMAKKAGFDGIEVHAANGYLIDQFLRDATNQRSDAYGGNAVKRMRFLNEVLDAVCDIWPSQRVGVRLTPENSFNSISDTKPQQHFEYFVQQLSTRKLAYLHMLEGDMLSGERQVNYRSIRDLFQGVYIANNGYNKESAQRSIDCGDSDLVAFGVLYISNPDLVYRFENDLPLNETDQSTFYGGNEIGYTDYPFADPMPT